MNNITIGQYIPGDSWLHRLDPRMKFFSLVVLLVATFIIPISTDWTPMIAMLAIFVGMMVLTATAGVPIKKMLNGLKPIVFLLTFTFFIQLFFISEGKLLVSFDFHMSLTSVLAIIFLIVFYNWSKKYIKFRVLYFLIVV